MSESSELTDLLHRDQIRDVLARLCRAVDRRDGDAIRAAYWPDAADDQAVAVSTVDELIGWVVPGDPRMKLTLHTLGQSVIDLRGDVAFVESHVTAYHRIAEVDGDTDQVLVGRYLDRMERRSGQWRIAHRKLVCDWHSCLGSSVDWTLGLFGMPFVAADAVGAARGDASETFFAAANVRD